LGAMLASQSAEQLGACISLRKLALATMSTIPDTVSMV
jgi:hypothetical protein